MKEGVKIPLKIDIVFSGGGVKAFTFVGALKVIEQEGFQPIRVAGTSAGAILSAFMIANYSSREIENMLYDLYLKEFLDSPKLTSILPMSKYYYLFFNMGFYKGKKFEQWIESVLAYKNIHTFGDIPKGHLKMIVSDLTLKKLIVIPDDLEEIYGINPKKFSIAKAVRISAGFPLFFMPETIKNKKTSRKSLLIDGGLTSNFPLWLFTKRKDQKDTRPVLGVQIEGKERQTEIKNIIDFMQALLITMKQSHQDRLVHKFMKDIISIPVDDISTMDLSLTDQTKSLLIEKGEQETRSFLKKWPT